MKKITLSIIIVLALFGCTEMNKEKSISQDGLSKTEVKNSQNKKEVWVTNFDKYVNNYNQEDCSIFSNKVFKIEASEHDKSHGMMTYNYNILDYMAKTNTPINMCKKEIEKKINKLCTKNKDLEKEIKEYNEKNCKKNENFNCKGIHIGSTELFFCK